MNVFQTPLRVGLRGRYVSSAARGLIFTLTARAYSTPPTFTTTTMADITAVPAANQHITHDGKEYTTVKEGLAYILIPAEAATIPQTSPKGDNQPQSVFYNPIQQFNRDLSVLAIKAYGEGLLQQRQQLAALKHKNKKRKRGNDESLASNGRKAAKVDQETGLASNGAEEAASLGKEENVHEKEATEPAPISEERQAEAGLEPPPEAEARAPDEQQEQQEQQDGNAEQQPRQTPFTILDALSATGLRALRYAKEIPFTTSITANDLLPEATKSINLNVQHNQLVDKIHATTGNAIAHMYNCIGGPTDAKGPAKPKYTVIDLDPYGTAAPFLDAAVQAVADNGLLCVTCTDAGVWASASYPEKAFSLYGGTPIKGQHSHEGGLRLILHSIATTAARYGYAIEPLLSLSIDFYARMFVRVYKSPADVKFLAGRTMLVYNCDQGCGAWTTQMLARNKLAPNKKGSGYFYKHTLSLGPVTSEYCPHCGSKTHMAGPMYAGPLHSQEFIKRILDDLPNVSKDTYATTERIEGMLSVALEEIIPPLEEDTKSPYYTDSNKPKKYDPTTIDHYPFSFIPSVLSKFLHCVTPHDLAMRGALRHLGYRVVRSHTKPGSIKTDAPWEVIWEVMREWVKQKAPIRDGAIREGSAAWRLMGYGERTKDAGDESGDEATKSGSNGTKKDGANSTNGERAKLDVVFDEKLGMEKDPRKLVRYQINPRENWGPMNRAKGRA
ncbi:N2,N2-dimethylguanosine tRNA methyltransferase-like protein [Xylogone sp. PMI_703]|nr:N2,N2-dimethylguanosine tRNA methyltransferase-like protein [Xylogone sp. PMI_703]